MKRLRKKPKGSKTSHGVAKSTSGKGGDDPVQGLRQRLAEMEFRAARYELALHSFDTRPPDASPTESQGSVGILQSDFERELLEMEALGLPQLAVSIGALAASERPEELPAIGILVTADIGEGLEISLLRLLEEHHNKPFARLLFLCQRLDVLPFLGRYGFAYCEVTNPPDPNELAVIARKFGIEQVRHLSDGSLVWRSSQAGKR